MNAKVGLSTIEKINHLLELEKALNEKLAKIRAKRVKERESNLANGQTSAAQEKVRTSSIEEDEEGV